MPNHQTPNRISFKSFLLPAALAVLAMLLAPAAFAQDKVVAKVDGRVITEADVRLAEAEIGADLAQYPTQTRRRVVIEFLIQNELFAVAAEKKNVADSTAFKERKHYWDRRNMRDSYFDTEIRSRITDAETRAFYDAQFKNFKACEQVRASHILVATEDEAKAIFEQIAHDGDFAQLAQKHSTDPGSKVKGGDLGYFSRRRMPPDFAGVVFSLAPGRLSDPFRTGIGWHIVEVTDTRPARDCAFHEVEKEILDLFETHRRELAVQEFIQRLRANSVIELFPENLE